MIMIVQGIKSDKDNQITIYYYKEYSFIFIYLCLMNQQIDDIIMNASSNIKYIIQIWKQIWKH